MPKAKTGNFTLRKIAAGVPAHLAAHRFAALQRSGQYSELRFIQRGKAAFDIVGYKWPDKGTRRQLNIGRARKNPTAAKGPTPNQVLFGMRGKTLVGWINRAIGSDKYEITYKAGAQTKTVTRHKSKIKFMAKQANPCPKTANPAALEAAKKLSEQFHGFPPRKIHHVNLTWPKSLALIGRAAQVDYICDKFDGKVRRYYHEFTKPAIVLAAPGSQPDGDSLLIIKGKFKLKPEGITG